MSAYQRNKGANEERAVVNFWREQGLDRAECVRVPLSGATEFAKADVRIAGLAGECKVRGDGFKNLYAWLGDNDFLTVRADRKPRLYVVPEHVMVKLLRRAT